MDYYRPENVRSSREIVAELHRQIAAKSFEQAALVAEFEALRAGTGRPGAPKAVPGNGRQAGGLARGEHISAAFRDRLRRYLELRKRMPREQAAAVLGIHYKTAQRYDSEAHLAGDVLVGSLAGSLAPEGVSRA